MHCLFFAVIWKVDRIPLFSSLETKFCKGDLSIYCLEKDLNAKYKISILSLTPEKKKNPVYQSVQKSFAELRQNNPKI